MSRVKKHPHAGLTGPKRAFVEGLHALSRSGRRHSEVFDDFLEFAFCAVARGTYQHIDAARADAFEQRYMALVGRRDPDYIRAFPPLFGQMQLAVAAGGSDFLGEVAGELGALHEGLGQFFTPYHVSAVMARMQLGDREEIAALIKSVGYITVSEPACGAGGMLLATADVLAEQGFDPTLCMKAQATDLSGTAFRMAYLQLAFRGVAAEVIHGDTITLEQFEGVVTPGMLLFHQHHRARALLGGLRRATAAAMALEDASAAPVPPTASAEAPLGRGQLDLFREVAEAERLSTAERAGESEVG